MRYLKNLFRKTLALVLAGLMVLGILPPIEAAANPGPPGVQSFMAHGDFNTYLAPGSTITPELRTGANPIDSNQALLSWVPNTAANPRYILRFPTNNLNQVVEMEFEFGAFGAHHLEVRYRILNTTGAGAYTLAPTPDFRVFSMPQGAYIPYDSVDGVGRAAGGYPEFRLAMPAGATIPTGTGFSFVVGHGAYPAIPNPMLAHVVHFLWFNNIMHVSVSGIQHNQLQPFHLRLANPPAGTAITTRRIEILTGFDFIGSLPVADHQAGTPTVLTPNLAGPGAMHLLQPYNILDYGDITHFRPAEDYPDNTNATVLQFQMPNSWQIAGGAQWNGQPYVLHNTPPSAVGFADLQRFALFFDLGGVGPAFTLGFTAADGVTAPATIYTELVAGILNVQISNLPYSTVFPEFNMEVVDRPIEGAFTSITHAFLRGAGDMYVHTFMRYRFGFDEGFYVEVFTYNMPFGYYTLHIHQNLGLLRGAVAESITIRVDNTQRSSWIRIPLGISLHTLDDQPFYVQISARTSLADPHRMWSQVTRIVFDESWVNVGSPHDFEVRNHEVITRPVQGDPRSGDLEFMVRFNAASYELLTFIFSDDNLETVRLVYYVNIWNEPGRATVSQGNLHSSIIQRMEITIERHDAGNPDHPDGADWPWTLVPRVYLPARTDGIEVYAHYGFDGGVLWLAIEIVYGRISFTGPPGRLIFPNLYWMNAELWYQTNSFEIGPDYQIPGRDPGAVYVPGQGRESVEDYLVISAPSLLEFPPPQNLRILDTAETEFNLRFDIPLAQIDDFQFEVFGAGVSGDVFHNIFIGERENDLINFVSWLNSLERERVENWEDLLDEPGTPNVNPFIVNFEDLLPEYDPLIGQIIGNPQAINIEDYDDGSLLAALRAGRIILIRDIYLPGLPDARPTQTITLQGLDRNRSYYSAMFSRGHFVNATMPPIYVPVCSCPCGDYSQYYPYDMLQCQYYPYYPNCPYCEFVLQYPTSPYDFDVNFYSITTNVVGTTTRDDLPEPDPGAIVPGAPIVTHDRDTATQHSAQIGWTRVPPPIALAPPAVGIITYEIVRVRDTAIPDVYLGRRDIPAERGLSWFADLIDGLPNVVEPVFLRTQYVNGEKILQELNGTTWAQPPTTRFAFNPGVEPMTLTDLTLIPNAIYFYYVRTVWQVIDENGDESIQYSSWRGVSVTTRPVQSPINLQVIRTHQAPTLPSPVDHTRAMIIQFEALVCPIELAADLAANNQRFSFQFSLMDDDGPWGAPVNINTSTLLGIAPFPSPDLERAAQGYHVFTFVITGLAPGTQYAVRVRLRDMTRTPPDYSAWSNIAYSRTDTDQDEYDRIRDERDLYGYLLDLLREFVRRPYWMGQNSANIYRAIYRPSMTTEFFARHFGNLTRLADTYNQTTIFYIPQSHLIDSRARNRGMMLGRQDMEISMPMNFISLDVHPAIVDANRRIRDVREVVDYYLRITTMVRPFAANAIVDGRAPAGQEVVFNIELVEATTTARNWDNATLTTMLTRIEGGHYTGNMVGLINQMLNANMSFEDMTRRLRTEAERISHIMANDIRLSFAGTLGRVVPISQFSAPITVSLTGIEPGFVANGLQWATNTWVRRETMHIGQSRGIHSITPGTFAFNFQQANFPGINNLPNAQTLTGIITRLGLDDFVGSGASFDMNSPASVREVAGVAARLAGAPATADPIAWLRGRGVIVPTRAPGANATNQEMVHLMMAMYEIRTNTRISAMRITNFGATANMQGVDSRFLRSIQAANELNFIQAHNFNPAAHPTTGGLLQMLELMNRRLGF